MDLSLRRVSLSADGIFSNFFDEDENIIAVSVERSYNGKPKLPDGHYMCERRMSPHFGYEVFQIMDVPGCDSIEIHRGNTQWDSIGCVCVGTEILGITVTESKKSFLKFMDLQKGNDSFALTVSS